MFFFRFRRRFIGATALLKKVAKGDSFRIIDLRGDYKRSIPTAIPTSHTADIFFEEEQWVQDMLGVPFDPEQPVVLVCSTGAQCEEARNLFYKKNRKSRFRLVVLKGGLDAYQEYIERRVRKYNRKHRKRFSVAAVRDQFMSLGADPQEFQRLAKKLFGFS
jgi:rhodanese-related sulfurtransferase